MSLTRQTCALGGFLVSSDVETYEKDGKLLNGRQVITEFPVTDQLIAFTNDDLLPRIQGSARYTEAIWQGPRTFFLVHNIHANRFPEEALPLFGNTFKMQLSNIMLEEPEKFHLIKHGREPVRIAASPPREPTILERVGAVDSKGGFQGDNWT